MRLDLARRRAQSWRCGIEPEAVVVQFGPMATGLGKSAVRRSEGTGTHAKTERLAGGDLRVRQVRPSIAFSVELNHEPQKPDSRAFDDDSPCSASTSRIDGGRCRWVVRWSTSLPYLSDTRLACRLGAWMGMPPGRSIVNIKLVVATALASEGGDVGPDALAARAGS